MTYHHFEDLPVWQAAIELADRIDDFTHDSILKSSLRNQIERAALSVSNNIAEGFERVVFPYIARGSAGETRSMLRFIGHCKDYAPLQTQLPPLVALAESCSRQIYAWIGSLQNSAIKGQRHRTAERGPNLKSQI